MGLLDRFRKQEKISFQRDERGNVIGTSREYSGRGSNTPVSDKLLSQVKSDKKAERIKFKQEQKRVYDDAFKKARLERMRKQGRVAGSTTVGDRFSNLANIPPTRYSVKNNYNPFGSMFDTGMKASKRPKSSKGFSKAKYAVVGGKAYPIAGKTKSKKKKKKRSSGGISGGFNMFDNWGYMK